MYSTPLPGIWSLFTLFFKGTLMILCNSLCAFFFHSAVQFRVFSAQRPQHNKCSFEFGCAHKYCGYALQLHWINSGEKKKKKKKIMFWNPRCCWYAGSFDIESEKPDWKVMIWITHRGCRGYLVRLCQNPPSPCPACLSPVLGDEKF